MSSCRCLCTGLCNMNLNICKDNIASMFKPKLNVNPIHILILNLIPNSLILISFNPLLVLGKY